MHTGCGTGKLARILVHKVPCGIVYAIDFDSNMIQVASKNLNGITYAKLLTVQVPTKFDVKFSNAAIHWILDHRRVFENFLHLLNNEGRDVNTVWRPWQS
jgi:trans-aconitate methyltransferase